jgi:hypothetical protein
MSVQLNFGIQRKKPSKACEREDFMPARPLGFVGIGRMGEPMAGRVLDAGFQRSIFGARREATKALAARGACFVRPERTAT